MDPLMDNYLALYLCIKADYSPDKAMGALGFERDYKNPKDEDLQEMIKLRNQGVGYKEIAKRFKISHHAVYQRIQRAKGGQVS